MQTSGYSGTPLAKKLGIKSGYKIRLVNEPACYFDLLPDIPVDIEVLTDKITKKDLVHYFCKHISDLQRDILSLRNEIEAKGMIWVSWPKKASKVETDVTEDVILPWPMDWLM